jgi:hypothetical protein
MSVIKDTFFGGAEKKAAKSQQKGIEKGIQATERATREAREAAIPLFGKARRDLQQGFQGALDVFGQSLPAQVQTFQGGNVGAQEQLLAGLPQFQNAILGNQIDFSQLQPTQVQTPDLSFFQQRLPGMNPAGVSPESTSPMIDNAFAPRTQFQGALQDGFNQGAGGLTPIIRGSDFQSALADVNAGKQINRNQVAALLAGTSGGNAWQR